MADYAPTLIALRGFMIAACVVLLAGCRDYGSTNSAATAATPVVNSVPGNAPKNLVATAGNMQAALTWSVTSGATSYDVKRATTSGGPYTPLAHVPTPSYTDDPLSNGTTYYYVVSAVNSAGQGADSAEASATPDPAVTTPPIPLGLAAVAGNAQISLTWSVSATAASYNVKRATVSGGPYSKLASVSSPAYTDTTAANATTYYYVVSAVSSAGESGNSSQVSATPDPTIISPPVPQGVVAVPGNAQASLTWSASKGASVYNVQRHTASSSTYTQMASVNSTSFIDSTVSNGSPYYYVVSAANAAGESPNSAPVAVVPDPTITSPPVPQGLAAIAGDAQASLSWSASQGAASYNVKRSTTAGGPYTQLANVTAPAYTDTAVSNGTTYYYVVSAVNPVGESANSGQAVANPAVPTPPPTTFGTWINVTPPGVNLTSALDCGNYGAETIQADTANPGTLYTFFHCQGLFKSTDYGQTWKGPINTGTNGTAVGDSAGGITISPSAAPGGVPTIYMSAIRGQGLGFWKSVNGGIDWTNYSLSPLPASRQDVYPPIVDPYNPNHLLMCGHEQDYLIQSVDGGHTWSNVALAQGMLEQGGTGYVFFINTGKPSTTASTWLWMAQQSGGAYGTWRTTQGGANWTRVDTNEHPHGSSTIYQPDNGGVVYMAGAYSSLGWGVLRSTDYGQTWTHVGTTSNETVVVGTAKNIYSMYGYPVGVGGSTSASFELAGQPGTGSWVTPATPSAMSQGPGQIAVVNDGTHSILVGAMHNSGLWRYIEP